MFKIGVFIHLSLFLSISLFSQELKTFKVNPGQKVYDVIGPKDRYAFPEFQSGIVYFKNDRIGGSRMNWNALIPAIEYISDKGDTLTLDNLETIRYILIAQDTFYVEKVPLWQFAREGNVRLARSKVILVSNHQRIGSHGQVTDASVASVSHLSSSGQPMRDLVANDIMTFKEHITYYFGNQFGQFKLASKKNLYALFGNSKKEIENYLDTHPVNYLKEADMRELLTFLSTL